MGALGISSCMQVQAFATAWDWMYVWWIWMDQFKEILSPQNITIDEFPVPNFCDTVQILRRERIILMASGWFGGFRSTHCRNITTYSGRDGFLRVESLDSWGKCKCGFLHCHSLLSVHPAFKCGIWRPNLVWGIWASSSNPLNFSIYPITSSRTIWSLFDPIQYSRK